jgi:amino acid adenylation domain-containing protein/non-ribosomal peptide synthase protein (TIGR01720 family)
MSDMQTQIANLSAEKRRLLELMLKREGVDLSRMRIARRERPDNTAPLSFAQQRLWFLDQLDPGSASYNIPTAVRLRGRLDAAALHRSLNDVVRRHETLRTTFAQVDQRPVQVIAPELALPLPLIDLRDQSPETRDTEARRLAEDEARTPFDLARGPLLRATLIRLADDDYLALLTLHHIIADGWSMSVLVAEMAAGYTAHTTGQPAPLPDLPIHYADFAVWQREWLQGAELERQLSYWKEQLAGSPPILELPIERPRPATRSSHGATLAHKLPANLTATLEQLSKQEGATLFMTLLAAFQTLLYRYSGREDLVVGTPIANRTRAEVEGLIGFFVNTLALRGALSGNSSFRELVRCVRATTLDAYAHQDAPFEMLVEALQPERTRSHAPLFQVMFVFQNAARKTHSLPGLSLSTVEVHNGSSTFDLTLSISEEADGLEASLEYATDLFDAATIQRMLGHLQTLLESIAAEPDCRIGDLPLLTDEERRQVLDLWNDTSTEYPTDRCVHELFTEQAHRTPDAVAVVCGAEQLSYAELNARANQLAHYLRKRGVGPETLVGICAERSPEMIIAVLGVLKAGGAYLPLDPSYPTERLAWMLEDAQPVVVLGTGDWGLGNREQGTGNREQGTGVRSQGSGVRGQESGVRGQGTGIREQGSNDGQRTTNNEQRTTDDGRRTTDAQGHTTDDAGQATQDAPGNTHHITRKTADNGQRTTNDAPRAMSQIIDLAADWRLIAQESETEPDGGATPDNLAYVIYTSGSTGKPKGTLLEHHGLTNLAHVLLEQFDIRSDSRVLQFAAFGFDACVTEIFMALLSGARLYLAPRETLMSPPDLMTLLRTQAITTVTLPPSLLALLPAEDLPHLRTVASAGETCAWDVARRWAAGRRFLNGYGPTEATVAASYYCVEDVVPGTMSVPIGRPLANVQIYLLDRHQQPVPVGVPGEIHIGGVGVARGYLNRPELTKERFIANPFGDGKQGTGNREQGANNRPPTTNHRRTTGDEGWTTGGREQGARATNHEPRTMNHGQSPRLYKTGDLARYLPDGAIEFLGRIDHQVKLRGYRIELGEIETALREQPDVRDAVVLLREDTPGDRRLVAYIVEREQGTGNREQESTDGRRTTDDGQLTTNSGQLTASLRAALKETLPEYMIPSAFVVLDALPLTPNGKIDRQVLPPLDYARPAPEAAYAAPRTPVEGVLAELWAEVLGVARVGIHDDFFALGGHSLPATQLVIRARDALGVDMPLRAIFEAPTVAGFAERVTAELSGATGRPPPIEPTARDRDLPLSYSQQRLWFLDQLDPNSPQYNIPTAVHLNGQLNIGALEQSLNEMIRRHETLRTTFRTVDGQPVQIIAPPRPTQLLIIDLCTLQPDEREVEAHRLATAEAREPFNLAEGPLLRTTLIRLADDDHVALFTMHHTISDGWSAGVFIREISAIYDALIAGRTAPLPDLPIQYADYAAWQRRWLQGETLERQLAYWKRQLGNESSRGSAPPLTLPTERPRPAIQSARGARLPFSLPLELAQDLMRLSRRENATLFMALLTAFQALLARYSGQDDISVGTPIANRTRGEVEGLIGCFINTLVLRADLSGDPTFIELLQQVRELSLGAYAHQDAPFEMVVDAVQPERNLSYTPLFQVMFILQNTPMRAIELPGLRLSALDLDTGMSNFDLTLIAEETAEGIDAAFEYNSDLFDATTIERMITHFRTLIAGIVAAPERPLSRLPLLSEAERRQALIEWNATNADYSIDYCVHEPIVDRAAQTPDAIAVILGEQFLTYAELNARANQLAHYLRRLGVGPDTLVALCIERSPEMIIGLLGILKAGGAYLPIDPSYPAERIRFMLEDAQPVVLLGVWGLGSEVWSLESGDKGTGDEETHHVTRDTQDGKRGREWARIDLSADWPTIAQEGDGNLEGGGEPDDLAYVIYTSGSTGQPKGVEITHRAVVNHNLAVRGLFQLTPADRVLQFATLAFDAAVEEIFPTLQTGATLVLRPHGPAPGAAELMRLIEEQQLTVLDLPTAYWHTWVAELERLNLPIPPSLRLVIVGGEAVIPERYAAWQRLAPDVAWLNTYGPTEATVIASSYAPAPGETFATGSVPIGRPIANTQCYILDAQLQPVPIGVPGELYIGGAGVARGYRNRPELTAERFVRLPTEDERRTTNDERRATDDRPPTTDGGRTTTDHRPPTEDGGRTTTDHRPPTTDHRPPTTDHRPPTTDHRPPTTDNLQSLRLYKTGDRARYRPDSVIEFLGRVDAQVKLRGFRVEPGEVEAALRAHPDVCEVAVVARANAVGEVRLVAYLTTNDERRTTDDGRRTTDNGQLTPDRRPLTPDLRSFLQARLPEYMIPSAFVALDTLPMLPNGKLDRRALPEPKLPVGTQVNTQPRTPEEELLAVLFAQALGVPAVGRSDDFFALGGHSLPAMQLVARMGEAFQIELPLRALFDAPTVAGMAETIAIARREAAEMSGLPLTRAPRGEALPLSFAQQRLWFLDQLDPGSPTYNIPLAVTLHGPLDPARLSTGLERLIARHEALRTVFPNVQGQPQQVILPPGPTPLEVIDLRALSLPEREAEVQRLAQTEAGASFDLARGPLVRALLLQLGDDEHALLLTLHHIITDGWSMGVLLRELAFLSAQGEEAALSELPVQYADYAVWQRAWLECANEGGESPLQRQLAYWTERLAGAPPLLELPIDRPRPPVQTYHGATLRFALPPALYAGLMNLSRSEGATLFMTLLAAFQVLLSRYSHQTDISVGTPIAGRTRAELENVVGFFVNTLVARSDLAGGPEFVELLQQVRERTLEAYAHQDVPFELLVEALQPQRDMSHAPLFQVMFAFQNAPYERTSLTDLSIEAIEIESDIAKFDLTLIMTEEEGELYGALEYNTDLFDRSTIERMAGHLQNLLAAIVTDPTQAIDRLPLLTDAERSLLDSWNDTQSPYRNDLLIHQLFEAQAARTPDAVAVVFGDEQMTYAELNARANRLARYLQRLGVGPETLVGVCMERSLELIVGLVGIFKAGGAYLPLDPSYPAERLAYMLEDAEPVVVLGEWASRGVGEWGSRRVGETGRQGDRETHHAPRNPQPATRNPQPIIDLIADWSLIAQEADGNLAGGVTPDNLAYVIYTSGSTGQPKGVQITQRAIANHCCDMARYYELTPDDRVLQFASLNFDASLEQMLPTLIVGARLVLRDVVVWPPADFHTHIRKHALTVINLPTAYWTQLTLEWAAHPDIVPADLLRLVIIGGDAMRVETVRLWQQTPMRAVRLLNAYGPTETTITATTYETPAPLPDDAPFTTLPIGRPLANRTMYILDEQLQPVPIGVPGELYIGGAGLSRGYLNRPELTGERFVRNPFGDGRRTTDDGRRTEDEQPTTDNGQWTTDNRRRTIANLQSPTLYRTGDFVRYRPDGVIEFLGRTDAQVKIRGFRVEPGEVEAALLAHPDVREAVVIAREDTPGEKRLVAYIVNRGLEIGGWGLETGGWELGTGNWELWANNGRPTTDGRPYGRIAYAHRQPTDDRQLTGNGSPTPDPRPLTPVPRPPSPDFRAFLQTRLPEFMLPSVFVLLDALPKAPSGKLDRQALPAPDLADVARAGVYAAPRTPVEQLLAGLWGRLLHVTPIGRDDNFFALGGHSLLATQLVARVRETFQIDLPLRAIFEAPTIAALAAQVERVRSGELTPIAPISPSARASDIPLSFAQQRLWFLDQLEPNSPAYNMPLAVRLQGTLDVAALEGSLTALVARHEMLRTTFPADVGKPIQRIAPPEPLPLTQIDLGTLLEAEHAAAIERYALADAQTPFDLAQGPLLRALLLRLADNEHVLLLTLHHIITDGWSIGVLLRELVALYAAAHGADLLLEPLPIQYADYAVWQREWLQGAERERQVAYWAKQLAGAPPLLELPTDRPRPPVQTFNGATLSFALDQTLSADVEQLSRERGVTPFMTLLAAFQVLLMRYSGQTDISVGTPIAGRNRRELEGLIGFFVNTLALRVDLSGNPSFGALLQQVREIALDAYAHQDVPFELIVETLQPQRDLSHTPLFQVMFVLQNTPEADIRSLDALRVGGGATELMISALDVESAIAKFDLTLFMFEQDGQFFGQFEYNTDLFDTSTIERMIGHFQILLAAAVADPAQPIAHLPLLTEAERKRILVEWNATQADFPAACFHELFEAQAVRTPQAIAVSIAQGSGVRGQGSGISAIREPQLTYAELNARANQLARYLQRLGVGPETIVGVCMERSLELLVGLLGILKAGGAYLPLDPSYPAERLRFMLEDARPLVVLGAGGWGMGEWGSRGVGKTGRQGDGEAQHATRNTQPIIDLIADWPLIAREPDENLERSATPDNLAYVIYTSGSTGKPKGVQILHRGLTNYLHWCTQAYPVAEGQGAPVHSSISFDLTITGLFAPLLVGRRVYLAPEDLKVEALADLLRQERDFSLVKITPAHLDVLGRQLDPHELAGRTRAFIIGGEQLTAETVTFWQAHAPDTMLVNEYGPTETVVGCCVYVTPPGVHRAGAIPIGRPIANTQLYILDEYMQPVPIGVVGELYIGGAGVARGYLNRPELTAERFVDCGLLIVDCGGEASIHIPQSKIHNRIYRTGDLARYGPNGVIEFLGRRDEQVKIRGFRIELGEIEAALLEHPSVREAAVAVREETPGEQRLVAYVVNEEQAIGSREQGTGNREQESNDDRRPTTDDRRPTTDDRRTMDHRPLIPDPRLPVSPSPRLPDPRPLTPDLRSFLAQRLPEYMLPSAFVTLEALPLTSNGKVDRRALPAPGSERPELATAYVAPRTPAEQQLAAIWAQVLGLDQVGVHDNFFDLGGDSILSIQVIARARQAGLHVTPRQLFQEPTVAGLAALAGTGHAIVAEQGIVEGPLPLTPIQRWFLEQAQPEPHYWNQTLLLETAQPLERAPLEATVTQLLTHHDALRLRFSRSENEWHQINAGIDDTAPVDWFDLSEQAPDGHAAAIEAAARNLQAGLNLEHGPLLRVAYFDLGPGRPGRLLLVIHHLAVDGVSWQILIEDFQSLYQQFSRGLPVHLPPKSSSFRQWARRLSAYAASQAARDELDYWLAVSAGVHAQPPVDLPGADNTEESVESVVVTLEPEETGALLRDVPYAYRTEINDALLAALSFALADWMHAGAWQIDLEGHGREDLFDDLDVSRTVGWFTSVYPVRLEPMSGMGPGAALQTVKERLRRIPRRGVGYGILRYLGDEMARTRLAASPRAAISFNYLGQIDRALGGETSFGLAPESSGPDRSPRNRRSYLLDIIAGVVEGRLQVEWLYSANLHHRATIAGLADRFITALRELIAHCQAPDAGSYTPADVAEFGWDESDFANILAEISKHEHT